MGYLAKATGNYSVCMGGGTGVASGANSGVFAGETNTANNTQAVVIGGNTNTASGAQSAVIGGLNKTASGNGSVILGGSGSSADTASGNGSFIIGGSGANTSSGTWSGIIAGDNSSTNSKARAVVFGSYGKSFWPGGVTFANGSISSPVAGRNQGFAMTLARTTTDATELVMQDHSGNSGMALPADASMTFQGTVNAMKSDGTKVAGYTINGVITNDSGTTTLNASNVTALYETNAAWDCVLSANDTSDSLEIKVTGEAATTVYWTAFVTGAMTN